MMHVQSCCFANVNKPVAFFAVMLHIAIRNDMFSVTQSRNVGAML